MEEVIARINASTPTGRKIIRQLETHKKTVKLEYPDELPEYLKGQKFYTLDEAFDMVAEKLNKHYGTDYKL